MCFLAVGLLYLQHNFLLIAMCVVSHRISRGHIKGKDIVCMLIHTQLHALTILLLENPVIGVGREGAGGAPAPPIFFWRGQSPPNILGLILVDI